MTNALDSFRCCKDDDIETFLRQKAFDFIDKSLCSVYLILDEDKFDEGLLVVDAFFTLSHKSLISNGISKTKIQRISGGFKHAEALHFVLIGQLGKHIYRQKDGEYNSANISSAEILDFAFDIIKASSNLIPCRFVLIECSKNEKVQKVYTDYGFQLLQEDDPHDQFFKAL